MHPARIERIPQAVGASRHLESVHVVVLAVVGLVVALRGHVGQATCHRLDVVHEQVPLGAAVVAQVVGEVPVMEDCVVPVGVNFFLQSCNRRHVLRPRTHVAEDQQAHCLVQGEIALRLEDELPAPAVGIGAHAVGVEVAWEQGGHGGCAHVQVSLQDLGKGRVVRETHPGAWGREGVAVHYFGVGGDWGVLHAGTEGLHLRRPGH